MEAKIGGAAATQTLKVDLISSHYGTMDGYSFCKDSQLYSIKYLPETLPTWVVIQDNVVTIKSMTAIDEEAKFDITVQVFDDRDRKQIDKTFEVALVTDLTESTQ